MPLKGSRGPWFWPLLLTAAGVALLLNNFLLLGDFNLTTLWPLLLVVVGAVVLLEGDWTPSTEGRTFGVTRGSVESATLEISAGEIDVQIRGLEQEGRLIAGQYALNSRPVMQVNDTHANLRMNRSATPWISFADWEMALARDLPWQIRVSTHLGQVNVDLSALIVQDTWIASGIGDIRIIAPQEALNPLHVRSALGSIHFISPVGYQVRIIAPEKRLFKVHADERRYETFDDGVYVARDVNDDAPLIEIFLSGTFGDAYLT